MCLVQADLTLRQRAQKHRTSATAGAPRAKKKMCVRGSHLAGQLLSKKVACLSTDMLEMKYLLQNLQTEDSVPTATVASTEDAHSYSSSEEPTYLLYTPHSPPLGLREVLRGGTLSCRGLYSLSSAHINTWLHWYVSLPILLALWLSTNKAPSLVVI